MEKTLIPITEENYKEATLKLWGILKDFIYSSGGDANLDKKRTLANMGYAPCQNDCPLCEMFVAGGCRNCPIAPDHATTTVLPSCGFVMERCHPLYHKWEKDPSPQNAEAFYQLLVEKLGDREYCCEPFKGMVKEGLIKPSQGEHWVSKDWQGRSFVLFYCLNCGDKLQPPKPKRVPRTYKANDVLINSDGSKHKIVERATQNIVTMLNLTNFGLWSTNHEISVQFPFSITKTELSCLLGRFAPNFKTDKHGDFIVVEEGK